MLDCRRGIHKRGRASQQPSIHSGSAFAFALLFVASDRCALNMGGGYRFGQKGMERTWAYSTGTSCAQTA